MSSPKDCQILHNSLDFTQTIARSSKYYFSNLIIRVQNELYRIPYFLLAYHSLVFRDMFVVCGNEQAEGSSDENPLFLPCATVNQFDGLIAWMTGGYDNVTNPPSLEDLIDILKVANLYIVPAARKYALSSLRDHPYLSKDHALTLNIGWENHVPELFTRAMHAFITDTHDLAQETQTEIPQALKDHIKRIRQLIWNEHRRQAYMQQNIYRSGWRCVTTANCKAAWKRMWSRWCISRARNETIDSVDSAVESFRQLCVQARTDLCQRCLTRSIQTNKARFSKDYDIMVKEVEKLVGLYLINQPDDS